jgi:hypothetical protein
MKMGLKAMLLPVLLLAAVAGSGGEAAAMRQEAVTFVVG